MASKSFVSFNMVTFEQGFVDNKNKHNLKSVLFRLQSDVKRCQCHVRCQDCRCQYPSGVCWYLEIIFGTLYKLC